MSLIRFYAGCSRISYQYQFHRTIPYEHNSKMPTGCEYSQQEKQLIFNVINFVESEKNSWKIPLYNVNERPTAMLTIWMVSVERLMGGIPGTSKTAYCTNKKT